MVIISRKLHGDPRGRISVSGGPPVICTFGVGGGLFDGSVI